MFLLVGIRLNTRRPTGGKTHMQEVVASNIDDKLLSSYQPYTLDEIMRVGEMFARSGYFKEARTASQVFSKIVAGQELGVGPMTALSMIHIVGGKATMDATLVGAQIKKSGRYDYRIKQSDEWVCALEFFERGKSVGESSFDMNDARRAGLASRDIWKSYPKDMLRSRAMTRGARMFCPDVFNGAIYTPEEIGAEVELDESGAMVVVDAPQADAHPAPVAPANASSPQRRVSNEDTLLIRGIYTDLGLDPKSRDANVHGTAMAAVSMALHLDTPITHWSQLTLAQLHDYLVSITPSSSPDAQRSEAEHTVAA
jgi:hypothetical protein